MVMKTIIIALLIFTISCKKGSKETCPERTYNIECSESYPDFEFPGYLTGTNDYNIKSHCLDDAIEEARNMSYDFGQSYKHCQVKPY
jgi:hypothetical protein